MTGLRRWDLLNKNICWTSLIWGWGSSDFIIKTYIRWTWKPWLNYFHCCLKGLKWFWVFFFLVWDVYSLLSIYPPSIHPSSLQREMIWTLGRSLMKTNNQHVSTETTWVFSHFVQILLTTFYLFSDLSILHKVLHDSTCFILTRVSILTIFVLKQRSVSIFCSHWLKSWSLIQSSNWRKTLLGETQGKAGFLASLSPGRLSQPVGLI